MENNRCSHCVESGAKGCNAEVGCLVQRLVLKRSELDKLLVELKDISEKISSIRNEVSELELKSRQEYNDLWKEIEDEEMDESSSDSSESSGAVDHSVVDRPVMVDVSIETDPLSTEAWWLLPVVVESSEVGPVDPGETSGYVDDN